MTITSLAGKKCFITGAASGIGRAVARDAARQGADLFLTDIDRAGLEAIVDELRASGGTVGDHRVPGPRAAALSVHARPPTPPA